MDDAAGLLELATVIVGGFSVAAGAIWTGVRLARRVCRMLPAIDRLHELFGDSPVEELHAAVREIQASLGEVAIRQRIAERHIALGIYVCGPDGRCEWANDYLCDAFGLDSTEMRGFGWLSAIKSDDRERVHKAWISSVENDMPYRERYTVEDSSRGQEWIASTEAWPVKAAGITIAYVGYVKCDEDTNACPA